MPDNPEKIDGQKALLKRISDVADSDCEKKEQRLLQILIDASSQISEAGIFEKIALLVPDRLVSKNSKNINLLKKFRTEIKTNILISALLPEDVSNIEQAIQKALQKFNEDWDTNYSVNAQEIAQIIQTIYTRKEVDLFINSKTLKEDREAAIVYYAFAYIVSVIAGCGVGYFVNLLIENIPMGISWTVSSMIGFLISNKLVKKEKLLIITNKMADSK